MEQTIDSATAKKLVAVSAITRASIIGLAGGWQVMLKVGNVEKTLGAQRNHTPRIWKSLDRCMIYLKSELNIMRIDLLDATDYSNEQPKVRQDTSERMRLAHQALAYDRWFKTQVQQALDDKRPAISHDDAKAQFLAQRAILQRQREAATS